jgi:hypothetical protein
LSPVGKNISSYNGVVALSYLADDQKKLDEYNQKVAEADEQYQKDKEDYNNKSLGSKFVEKAILNEGGKPKEEKVEKPYIRKTFDTNVLATYIKMEGFTSDKNSSLVVTFTSTGFERSEPKINKTSSTSNNTTTYKYSMELQYRSPVSVKVETNDGQLILNSIVEKANTYKKWQSRTYDSEAALYRDINPDEVLSQFESVTLEENLRMANELLNDNCAISTATREFELNNIESKKMDYSDYNEAYMLAFEGLNLVYDDKIAAKEKLHAAIAKWESALTEAKPQDKKARVNSEVMLATIFNISEAYLWCDDFSKASGVLVKTAVLDLSKKEEKAIAELKTFIADQKMRFEANNGNL